MSTSRMEAFSDGVFAVAITLLVLNLAVPDPHPGGDLAHDLLKGSAWPHYAAYAVSFLTIGIIWINHHAAVGRLRAVDHGVMMLNLLLLMTVVLLPFTTNLVATYLTSSYGHGLAAAIFAGSFLLMASTFAAFIRHTVFSRPDLLNPGLGQDERRAIWRRNLTGVLPYVLAVAIAPFSAYASLAVCGAVAVYYALPFSVDAPS